MSPSGPPALPRGWSRWTRPHDLAVAGAYLAVCLLLYASGIGTVSLYDEAPSVPLTFWIPVVITGSAGLAFRTRAVPAMLVVTGLSVLAGLAAGGSIPIFVLLFEMLFSATLNGTRRVSRITVLVAAGLALGSVAVLYAVTADVQLALAALLQAFVICLIPIWWAGNVRTHRTIADAERGRADLEQRLAIQSSAVAALDTALAVTEEREQIARDLHDTIAGQLSAIAIHAEAVLSAAPPGAELSSIRAIRENSLAALAQMRSMIDLLSAGADATPAAPDGPGALDQISVLVESARAAGVAIEVELPHHIELPTMIDHSLYRIVQEALTNVVKHAPGSRARLSVTTTPDTVDVILTNTLTTPRTVGSDGIGVPSMRLRAARLGGTCTVEHSADAWIVAVSLPLPARADDHAAQSATMTSEPRP